MWDRRAIAEAAGMLGRAAQLGRPGPYQLQAAIIACHAEAPNWEATDWEEVVALYDRLVGITRSPVAMLNQAIALRHLRGDEQALAAVDLLRADLNRYHLFHATRAEMLQALGRREEAAAATRLALELTGNPAERRLLETRLAEIG